MFSLQVSVDHFLFKVNGQEFKAVLKDLPRPVEIYQSIGGSTILKRKDVGQMLDCTSSTRRFMTTTPLAAATAMTGDVVGDMNRSDDILEYVVEDVVPYESWMQRHNKVSLSMDLNLILQHLDAFYAILDVTQIIEDIHMEDAAAVDMDDLNFDTTTDDDDNWMVEDESEEEKEV